MDHSNSIIQARSYHDFASLGSLKAESVKDPAGALKKAATQFEANFIQEMLKSMRQSIEKSDLVDQGQSDMYEEMMDKEIALQMAKRGSIGVAQMVTAQMKQRMSAGTPTGAPASGLPMQPAPVAFELKPKSNETGLTLNAQKAYGIKPLSGDKP